MIIKSTLLPAFIVLLVIFIYICDGNTSCAKEASVYSGDTITKKAYDNLQIDMENSEWQTQKAVCSPFKIAALQVAEKISLPKKKNKEIKYREITLVEDSFIVKFFYILHLKENASNTRKPGTYGELGPYQIRKQFWIDGCKQLKVDINSPEWCYEINVWKDTKCRTIILAYFEKYKVPRTIDDMCGAFNSGNRWTKKWNKTATYRKVYKEIWFKEYGEKID